MARSVMEIEDPDLRNAVWSLQNAVEERRNKQLRKLLHRNNNQQVARATQIRDTIRQGEKPEDA